MTKVISFISRKGGCGKTTNAINLATMLYSLGNSVTLLETDTNYTLKTLREMEVFKAAKTIKNTFPIVTTTDNKVIEYIKSELKKKTEYVIIDSAGKTTSKEIKELCLHSNLVIVPTSLTPNDLLVSYQTIQDINAASKINRELKIVALPNRLHGQTGKATIQKALQTLGVPVLKNFLPAKNQFGQFSTLLPEKEYLPVTKELIEIIK